RPPPRSTLFPYTTLFRSEESPKSNDDWIAVAASIREAFGYLPDPHSKDPVDISMLLKKMHTQNPVRGPKMGSKVRVEQHSPDGRSEEHTSELQSLAYLVC